MDQHVLWESVLLAALVARFESSQIRRYPFPGCWAVKGLAKGVVGVVGVAAGEGLGGALRATGVGAGVLLAAWSPPSPPGQPPRNRANTLTNVIKETLRIDQSPNALPEDTVKITVPPIDSINSITLVYLIRDWESLTSPSS
jgi:hypothetical protein